MMLADGAQREDRQDREPAAAGGGAVLRPGDRADRAAAGRELVRQRPGRPLPPVRGRGRAARAGAGSPRPRTTSIFTPGGPRRAGELDGRRRGPRERRGLRADGRPDPAAAGQRPRRRLVPHDRVRTPRISGSATALARRTYLEWKHAMLEPFAGPIGPTGRGIGLRHPGHAGAGRSPARALRRGRLPDASQAALLDRLDARGLAVWYGDDGSLRRLVCRWGKGKAVLYNKSLRAEDARDRVMATLERLGVGPAAGRRPRLLVRLRADRAAARADRAATSTPPWTTSSTRASVAASPGTRAERGARSPAASAPPCGARADPEALREAADAVHCTASTSRSRGTTPTWWTAWSSTTRRKPRRRARAQVLRLGAARHPPDGRDQGGHGVDRRPHQGEGGQEQAGAAVPRGRVRHDVRRGHLARGRVARPGGRARASSRRAGPGSRTASSGSARAATTRGSS